MTNYDQFPKWSDNGIVMKFAKRRKEFYTSRMIIRWFS